MSTERTPAQRIGPTLRAHRKSRGWKLQTVGRRAGLDYSYLSKIERGVYLGAISRESLEKIASAYQIPLEELLIMMGGGNVELPRLVQSADERLKEMLDEYRMIQPVAVPVVEHPAHAGHGGSEILDYVYVERASAVNKNLVCVPVKGNCMAPRIETGDRVIVDRDASPRTGDVVLAVVDEAIHVRRLAYSQGQPELRADNSDYLPIKGPGVEIVGVVVEVRRRP